MASGTISTAMSSMTSHDSPAFASSSRMTLDDTAPSQQQSSTSSPPIESSEPSESHGTVLNQHQHQHQPQIAIPRNVQGEARTSPTPSCPPECEQHGNISPRKSPNWDVSSEASGSSPPKMPTLQRSQSVQHTAHSQHHFSRPAARTSVRRGGRPSSIVSNSSSTSGADSASSHYTSSHQPQHSHHHSHHQGRFNVSASILSPSLATALGISSDSRRHSERRNSFYSLGNASTSATSLVGLAAMSSPLQASSSRSSRKGNVNAASSSTAPTAAASLGVNRRTSSPNMPALAHHRVSTTSISSFDSLPEGEAVSNFGGSPKLELKQVLEPTAEAPMPTLAESAPTVPRSSSKDSASSVPAPVELMPPPPVLPSSYLPVRTSSVDPSLVGEIPRNTVSFPAGGLADDISPKSSAKVRGGPIHAVRRQTLSRSQTEPGTTSLVINREEKMRKRGLVAIELLSTEKTFVESLKVLQDSFYQPLVARCGGYKTSPGFGYATPIISRKALFEIFSNFADILRLNSELLAQLEARMGSSSSPSSAGTAALSTSPSGEGSQLKKAASVAGLKQFPSTSPSTESSIGHRKTTSTSSNRSLTTMWDPETDTIGDILVPIAPFLKMYSLYVKNFSSALQRIETERKENEAFAKFLKETERSTWGRGKAFFGLGLQAHLLTIVQRIPRYKLLVGDLLMNTPASHKDHTDLKRAFEMIEQVASSINENVRQHEKDMMMLALQRALVGLSSPLVVPGRDLLRRGTLLKACRKDIQPRAFFLFSDCIMYARPVGSGGVASIEAAWTAIVRAGGAGASALEASGPWAPSFRKSGNNSNSSRSAVEGNSPTLSSEAFPSRARAHSGNMFNPNHILDALQAPTTHQLQFRDRYALQDCTVIGVEDNANSLNASASAAAGGTPYAFEIRTPDKSFAVYSDSAESREGWMNAIRDARNEWLKARRTLQAEEDSIEAKRERRRSTAAAAQAAAKARQSTYSLASFTGETIPEDEHESPDTGRNTASGSPVNSLRASVSGPPSRAMSLPSLPSAPSFAALLSNAASATTAVANGYSDMPVLEEYNAPAWVPDSRADRCMACSESFGVWRRKHHCRLCGRVICYNCSTRRFKIASYEEGVEDRPARACDPCYESTFPGPATPGELSTIAPGGESFAAGDGTEGEAGDRSWSSVGHSVADAGTVEARYSFTSVSDVSSKPDTRAHSHSGHGLRIDSPETQSPDQPVTPLDGYSLQSHDDSGASMDVSTHDAHQQSRRHLTVQSGHGARSTSAADAQNLGSSFERLDLDGSDSAADTAADTSAEEDEATRLRRLKRLSVAARVPPSLSAALLQQASSSGEQSEVNPSTAVKASAARMLAVTDNYFPQVQAATSGSGTFRLAPPRITTPEGSESHTADFSHGHGPALHHRADKNRIGQGNSYFGAVDFPTEEVVMNENCNPIVRIDSSGIESTPASPPRRRQGFAMHHIQRQAGPSAVSGRMSPSTSMTSLATAGSSNSAASGGSGASNNDLPEGYQHQYNRGRRPRMSAAARLSTYYGSALGLTPSSGGPNSSGKNRESNGLTISISNSSSASNSSPSSRPQSPLRKVSS